MTITAHDIRHEVAETTSASDGEYDIDAIVDTVIDRFGLVSIEDIDPTSTGRSSWTTRLINSVRQLARTGSTGPGQ